MKTITSRSGAQDLTLRGMLSKAGVGSFVAPLAIQYMNFLPTTCEPYAQGTMIIVKGLQTLLAKRGAAIVPDGGMDEKTVAALIAYAGPRWYDKSWAQLYGDLIDGRKWTSWDRESRAPQDRVLDYYDAEMAKVQNAKPAQQATSDYFDARDSLGATAFSTTAVGHTAYSHLGADDTGAGFKIVGSIAVPLTGEMLAAFKSLQRACNALLAKRGKPLIDVDGRIGPQTMAALSLIAGVPGSLQTVAVNAASAYLALVTRMQSEGASFVADPPPSTPPSQPGPNNTVINPPVSQMTTGFSFEQVLPFAAAGVAIALVMTMGKKSRSRSKRR